MEIVYIHKDAGNMTMLLDRGETLHEHQLYGLLEGHEDVNQHWFHLGTPKIVGVQRQQDGCLVFIEFAWGED